MPIPSIAVKIIRRIWYWQWKMLMMGLGPADKNGNYNRPASKFLRVSELPDHSIYDNRFVLIVGRSCPWAHRAWLMWAIRNLRKKITLIVVEPDRREGKWRFVTPFNGCTYLSELYIRCGSTKNQRATVPLMIDGNDMTILCNESAQLIELLNNWPGDIESPELMPSLYETAIEDWQNLLQSALNDGVYRCGFARQQKAYNSSSEKLFYALRTIEKSLETKGPWLCGQHMTLADIRLFPTLIRWELVYAPLFGCSRQYLWQFPLVWNWRQRLFSLPNVAETCDGEAIVSDYFGSLFPLNPSGIVPGSPSLAKLVLTFIPDPKTHE